MARVKTIQYSPKNYTNNTATSNVYGSGKYKIKKSKVVTVVRGNMVKTKTVKYGPVNQYGKQKKVKTITKTKK